MFNSIKLRRTFHEGWHNFRRNGWLTVATVMVFTLSLFVIGLTFTFSLATGKLLTSLEEKLNINVAFETDVPEAQILNIKKELEKYREVASVEYISRDQALAEFIQMSNDDPSISKALDEIGDNPLPASLTIHARYPDQYDTINRVLLESSFKDSIDRINYEKNKKVISSVSDSSRNARRVGTILMALFIIVALVVAFNTIRINMHSRRQEFEIMRLVGASNIYMRMPSIFEGILYGGVSAVMALILLFPAVKFVGSALIFSMAPGFLMHYFLGHFFIVFLALLVLGSGLGALSGFLALNRYSKV